MNPELRHSAAHVFVADIAAPALEGADEHHLLRVLRLRAGEAVSVADGQGRWRLCRLQPGGQLEPESDVFCVAVPEPAVTIGFAIPKGDRPEWIVQKLTELGVDGIVLLHADRSVVRWDGERAAKHHHRLARVAREAAMQSRQVRLPTIGGPLPVTGGALAEPGGDELTLAAATLYIGPEGGWSERELAAAPLLVAVGKPILRVETAAIAAATRLIALRDGHTTG